MLINHKFEESTHTYRVLGKQILATSDVIFLNGLYDFSMVPRHILDQACNRGSALHEAIHAYNTDRDVIDIIQSYLRAKDKWSLGLQMEVEDRMNGYHRFCDQHEVLPCGTEDEMEISRVYHHKETNILLGVGGVGATIDFPCYVDGVFTIVDFKTSYPNCGKKEMQDKFKWRLQLQSYKEALKLDDEFWKKYKKPKTIQKAILHLHPNLPRGFKYWQAPVDDSKTWKAAVIMAQQKLANGFKLDERRK